MGGIPEGLVKPPLVIKTPQDCPDRERYHNLPEGVTDIGRYARSVAATHKQRRCPTCRFLVVFELKEKA